VFRSDCWNEIDRVTPDIECVYEGDDPFAYSSRVVSLSVAQDPKCDCQAQFHKYEGELDPKGDAKDAMLAIMDSETLILPANEDGGDDVSRTVVQVS
tara:strand:+ start:956 stop:1246 length:291 start_codon:yes stop_codon:yes gene_type:complete